MSKIVVMNSVTLDGVMQGPGRPDEDTRGGFAHGGWAVPGSDELIVTKMAERMGENQAFLFGRLTYEELLASCMRSCWPPGMPRVGRSRTRSTILRSTSPQGAQQPDCGG